MLRGRLATFVKDAHASFMKEHKDTDPEIVVLTGNAPIHSQTIKPLLADPLAFECPPRVSTSHLC